MHARRSFGQACIGRGASCVCATDVMICKLSGGAASMKPPANRQAGTRGGSCFKCGKPGHWASSCPA
eukprot:2924643-Pleurochrysis_carterae.AAC.3